MHIPSSNLAMMEKTSAMTPHRICIVMMIGGAGGNSKIIGGSFSHSLFDNASNYLVGCVIQKRSTKNQDLSFEFSNQNRPYHYSSIFSSVAQFSRNPNNPQISGKNQIFLSKGKTWMSVVINTDSFNTQTYSEYITNNFLFGTWIWKKILWNSVAFNFYNIR